MDLQAIREELSQSAPAGWNSYSTIPGSATTPCLVVGLPETVTYDASFRSATILIPVFLGVNGADGEAEKALLVAAVTVANGYRAITSTTFRACRVTAVTDFQSLTIGANDALGCAIDLEITANT